MNARLVAVRLAVLAGLLLPVCGSANDDWVQHERGRQVFRHWCVSCHGPGQHTPGTMALYFKYQGQKQPMLEHRDDLTPAVISAFVRHGVSVMPFFRKTEISDKDLAALAAFLVASGSGPKPPLPPFPPPSPLPPPPPTSPASSPL